MSSKPRILVIDDEEAIHRFLAAALEAAGYEHVRATTGADGLSLIATKAPDAVVLDLGLPDMDGLAVLEKARVFYDGPILILSARDKVAEKIDSLDRGADDYVQKPFAVGELLARIRVAIRKTVTHEGARPREVFGPVEVDLVSHSVFKRGVPVRLTRREYRVLEQLVRANGNIVDHRRILASVWGPAHVESTHYLRIAIQHLRQKIEDDPADPRIILTEINAGYRIAHPAAGGD